MESAEEKEIILNTVREVLESRRKGFQNLIVILQDVQDRLRYIPGTAMLEVAKHLDMSPANVYGVATFYNQFRFSPPGKHHIKVCLGTACHIKGGNLIMDQWKRRLEIDEGERTEDGEYSIERVGCVGCCVMAPVSIVQDEVIGEMAPNRVDGILLQHRIAREQAEKETESKDSAQAKAGAE